jgi:hypothetical protein
VNIYIRIYSIDGSTSQIIGAVMFAIKQREFLVLISHLQPFLYALKTVASVQKEDSKGLNEEKWTMKNIAFWDIKTQFVLLRRHITPPLQSPAS